VRVVADDEAILSPPSMHCEPLHLRLHHHGIGPTHDDITADSVAKAFGVGIDHHPEVVARFREALERAGSERGAAAHGADPRRRRADQSATILAPGFKLGNVIVMAGFHRSCRR
jgi:molybdopterin-biosynthesis enzyme MoeA-like protein